MNCGLIAPTLGDRQSRARVNVHITRLVGGGGHHHSALFADPTTINKQQSRELPQVSLFSSIKDILVYFKPLHLFEVLLDNG